MRLEHYPVDKLKKEILDLVGKHVNLRTHKVFFFGSRVSGGGNERSDIDVGIEGPQEIPIKILGRIREEIENLPTLYKIEVVDFKSVSDEFREVALQHTEALS
ncbi:MAG: nucleotidyltransferase domain-containing protein [Ignavibacteriales bacterium]|nr:nucleotidyltransferase domain-containing protein [Ignavibacteriales bacterium]